MANVKGGRAARKRDRQNEKARKRNSVCKAKLHDAHKKLFKLADAGSKEDAEKKRPRQGREARHHHEEHG